MYLALFILIVGFFAVLLMYVHSQADLNKQLTLLDDYKGMLRDAQESHERTQTDLETARREIKQFQKMQQQGIEAIACIKALEDFCKAMDINATFEYTPESKEKYEGGTPMHQKLVGKGPKPE